ncbi:hypothetical protein IQ07DRAFT_589295 [Pyrenochaeta sp. DS3sAY3a]|nr:hypothetical protein IQ07DRAFT_589295 [Pyrenochaeta sp. DS3sAY3a]
MRDLSMPSLFNPTKKYVDDISTIRVWRYSARDRDSRIVRASLRATKTQVTRCHAYL